MAGAGAGVDGRGRGLLEGGPGSARCMHGPDVVVEMSMQRRRGCKGMWWGTLQVADAAESGALLARYLGTGTFPSWDLPTSSVHILPGNATTTSMHLTCRVMSACLCVCLRSRILPGTSRVSSQSPMLVDGIPFIPWGGSAAPVVSRLPSSVIIVFSLSLSLSLRSPGHPCMLYVLCLVWCTVINRWSTEREGQSTNTEQVLRIIITEAPGVAMRALAPPTCNGPSLVRPNNTRPAFMQSFSFLFIVSIAATPAVWPRHWRLKPPVAFRTTVLDAVTAEQSTALPAGVAAGEAYVCSEVGPPIRG
jgi:hypothetical protein